MFGACVIPSVACVFGPSSSRKSAMVDETKEGGTCPTGSDPVTGIGGGGREIRNIQQVLAEVHEDVSLSALVRSRSLRRPLVIGCLLMIWEP